MNRISHNLHFVVEAVGQLPVPVLAASTAPRAARSPQDPLWHRTHVLKRSAQAPLAEMRIQNAQPCASMTELVCHDAVSYWCCFTKFPFGSTSNSESLPFAFTDTS